MLVIVKKENLWTNAATIQSANVSITDVMECLHWNNASIKKELEGGQIMYKWDNLALWSKLDKIEYPGSVSAYKECSILAWKERTKSK